MQATGVIEPQRPGVDAEIEKTMPQPTAQGSPIALRRLLPFIRSSQWLNRNSADVTNAIGLPCAVGCGIVFVLA